MGSSSTSLRYSKWTSLPENSPSRVKVSCSSSPKKPLLMRLAKEAAARRSAAISGKYARPVRTSLSSFSTESKTCFRFGSVLYKQDMSATRSRVVLIKTRAAEGSR